MRGPALREFPHTTWMRIARIVEGASPWLLIGAEHREVPAAPRSFSREARVWRAGQGAMPATGGCGA
jgi:hypothetical protein